ncbi:MAG: nucleotidyltransferase family protein [Candidatus Nomurabacteria bacterium]|jgi:predicted nucleotidyltransferase|nr:nucleotidyltransferase family protein [Candidatus Nomurabacteria bacterium]
MDSITEDTRRLRKALADNKEALARIFAKYEVKNPRVFGSVARGDATANSDIDILVDSYKPNLGLMRLTGLINELEDTLGAPVDFVRQDLVKENRRKYILEGAQLAI